MTILIVENEAFVVEDIKDMLNNLGYSKVYDTDTVDGAMELVNSHQPDIVLIDIDLNGDKDGIELGEMLHQKGISFIYLSDLQDISTFSRAKTTQPQSNLAKPVNQLQLRNAILEAISSKKKSPKTEYILAPDKDKKVKINVEDIVYLKAAGNNCDIFIDQSMGYEKSRYTSSAPMGRVMDTINSPDFILVHRSKIVNYKHVKNVMGNMLYFKNNTDSIEMSSSYRSNLLKKIPTV